ncbi:hypothetical protein KCU65_g73, partial [Aureobasidium melanogenum]
MFLAFAAKVYHSEFNLASRPTLSITRQRQHFDSRFLNSRRFSQNVVDHENVIVHGTSAIAHLAEAMHLHCRWFGHFQAPHGIPLCHEACLLDQGHMALQMVCSPHWIHTLSQTRSSLYRKGRQGLGIDTVLSFTQPKSNRCMALDSINMLGGQPYNPSPVVGYRTRLDQWFLHFFI